jgi:hypothetical protein
MSTAKTWTGTRLRKIAGLDSRNPHQSRLFLWAQSWRKPNMAKEYNWLEHEILGDIDEIAPVIRPVPDLPLDSPLYKFEPRTGAANELCAKLEREELIDQLCPVPVDAQLDRDVAKFDPPAKADRGLDFVKHVLNLGAERAARKTASAVGNGRRSREIADIVDAWADDYDFATDGTRAALDRIKQGMTQLTNELVLEVAI